MEQKPKLIVFDLDYTLWPFWVDTHVTPPFRKMNGKIVDAHGITIKYYPEVPQILEHLHKNGYKLAVASRTGEIEGAEQLLHLLDWNKYFDYKEIYPGDKTKHFKSFKNNSGYQYEDMLFFDDEHRNIRDLSPLNVTCILVEKGMNMKVLEKGLNEFKKKHKN